MPEADFAFLTGVTIINKTAPRLLELAKRAHTVMVGPSVVMSAHLFDWGVEMMAGSVVADPRRRASPSKAAQASFSERLCKLAPSRHLQTCKTLGEDGTRRNERPWIIETSTGRRRSTS